MVLFHRDLGGAGKPPLIILHGLLGSSRNWQSAGKDLTTHFHVMALDLRNHGSSPHAAEMTYEMMVDDVAEWLDVQGLAKVNLLGHSMGGKVAMLFACRQRYRVNRLIVVDIAPKDYLVDAHRAEFAAMQALDVAHLRSRAAAEHSFEKHVDDWFTRKFLASNLEVGEGGRWRWQINLPALTASLRLLEQNSLRPEDRFDGEALFIVGEKSRYVGPADHDLIYRHFPEARIEVLPGSGHNPHIDAREAFVAKIRAAVT